MYWSRGNWTGNSFSLVPEIQLNYYVKNFTYVANENESHYTCYAALPFAYTRVVLDVTGQLKQYVWGKDFINHKIEFVLDATTRTNVKFSICNQQKISNCDCLKGFEPWMLKDWELGDHSNGCARKTPLQYSNERNDAFLVMPKIRFP